MANIVITPGVKRILSRSTVTQDLLVLPPGQLEPLFYKIVAKTIKLCGGVWKTNRQGFVFDSDPREKLGLVLETGKIIDTKKVRQAFYTPDAIADEIAVYANLKGQHVLEPSAGDGALVKACLRMGAKKVTCIELEETCRSLLVGPRREVIIHDFLQLKPDKQFSCIVMNPPFTRGQFLKHIIVAHAQWLSPGGNLFAVIPDGVSISKLEAFKPMNAMQFPAGAFRASGTNVATRLIHIRKD